MKENSVLEDIRTIRDQHARECGYDIHKLFQVLRKETEKLKTQGWLVVPAHHAPSAPNNQ
ncbi:MAG: hypothetical protein ACOYM3_24630 [Terrimicrobiaceae bacterium]